MVSGIEPNHVEAASFDAQVASPVKKSTRILKAIVTVAVMVGFATIVVYAYNQGIKEGSEEAAPILRAKGPSKVAPQTPGGLKIPHQDKLDYNLVGKDQHVENVERLLPPPELPLPKVIAKNPPVAPVPVLPPKLSLSADNVEADQAVSVPALPITSEPEVPPKVPSLDKINPLSKSVRIQPKAPIAKKSKSLALTRSPSLQVKAKGEFRIQIASMKNPAAAKIEWDRRLKQNKVLLGHMILVVDRVSVPGRGIFHRVQAGPIKNRAEAMTLCDKLKQRKVGCLVVSP